MPIPHAQLTDPLIREAEAIVAIDPQKPDYFELLWDRSARITAYGGSARSNKPAVFVEVDSSDEATLTSLRERVNRLRAALKLPTMPLKEFDRRAHAILLEIQKTLVPAHESDFVAINVESGEYVLGSTKEEVQNAFRERWQDTLPYFARVDGRPLVKFYGR